MKIDRKNSREDIKKEGCNDHLDRASLGTKANGEEYDGQKKDDHVDCPQPRMFLCGCHQCLPYTLHPTTQPDKTPTKRQHQLDHLISRKQNIKRGKKHTQKKNHQNNHLPKQEGTSIMQSGSRKQKQSLFRL